MGDERENCGGEVLPMFTLAGCPASRMGTCHQKGKGRREGGKEAWTWLETSINRRQALVLQ